MNLKLPISKNNCLTIEKLYDVKNDKYFIKIFLKILKKKKIILKLKLIMNFMMFVLMNKLFKNNIRK